MLLSVVCNFPRGQLKTVLFAAHVQSLLIKLTDIRFLWTRYAYFYQSGLCTAIKTFSCSMLTVGVGQLFLQFVGSTEQKTFCTSGQSIAHLQQIVFDGEQCISTWAVVFLKKQARCCQHKNIEKIPYL